MPLPPPARIAPEGVHPAVWGSPACSLRCRPRCGELTSLPPILAMHVASRVGDAEARISKRAGDISARLGAAGDLDPHWVAYRLQHTDPAVRVCAADTLGRMGVAAAAQAGALAAKLADPAEAVGEAAGRALGSLGPAGLDALAAALRGEVATARARAAQAVGWLKKAGTPLIQELADRVDDDDELVWRYSAKTLSCLGAPAARDIARRLGDRDPRTRQRVEELLDRMSDTGAAAVARLRSPPADSGTPLALRAPEALGTMGMAGAVELTTWLDSRDAGLRAKAAQTLGGMDDGARLLTDTMLKEIAAGDLPAYATRQLRVQGAPRFALGLASPDASLRACCAKGLASLCKDGEAQVAARHAQSLADRVREEDPAAWAAAAEALIQLGAAGASAVAHRMAQFRESDSFFRARAEEVLAQLGQEGANATAFLLQATDPKVRMHAARALGRRGPAVAAQADALAQLLAHDHEPPVRRAAAEALARLGEPGVIALESCMGVPQTQVRELAQEALARCAVTRSHSEAIRRDRVCSRAAGAAPP